MFLERRAPRERSLDHYEWFFHKTTLQVSGSTVEAPTQELAVALTLPLKLTLALTVTLAQVSSRTIEAPARELDQPLPAMGSSEAADDEATGGGALHTHSQARHTQATGGEAIDGRAIDGVAIDGEAIDGVAARGGGQAAEAQMEDAGEAAVGYACDGSAFSAAVNAAVAELDGATHSAAQTRSRIHPMATLHHAACTLRPLAATAQARLAVRPSLETTPPPPPHSHGLSMRLAAWRV